MKKIAIITYGNFPNGEAASVRLYCLAKLISISGYAPIIISMSRVKPFICYSYNGVEYMSIRSERTSNIVKVYDYVFLGRRALKVLKGLDNLYGVVPISLPLNAMLEIEAYAKKCKLQLITDRTEWYSPSEFKFGIFSAQYQQNDITNKYIIDDYWKVIAISTYLKNYFESKSIKTIRIPALMNVSEFEIANYQERSKRVILYAGNPGRKDSLDMIVEAISLLDDNQKQMAELRVFGVSKEQFISLYPTKKISDSVIFYGRVSREEVKSNLFEADFTILMRNSRERFAMAGFPSKVAESMSAGIPVITNYSSDLPLYLINNVNSVIVQDYSAESLKEAVLQLLDYSTEQIRDMRMKAYETAKTHFDFNNYIGVIKDLL